MKQDKSSDPHQNMKLKCQRENSKSTKKKKKRNHIQENHIRLSADFQHKVWRTEHDIFKVMKEKTQQSSIVSMQQGYQ